MLPPRPVFYPAHPALADWVKHIMIFEVSFTKGMNHASPFPPTPQNSIHFYPGDPMDIQPRIDGKWERSPDSIIVGPQVNRINLRMGLHHIIVSVVFQPGGLYRWLGIPLTELYDTSYDTALLIGPSVREVNEQLRSATSHAALKHIVETFLLKRAPVKAGFRPFEEAMAALIRGNGQLSIDKAASISCLSRRQFERVSMQLLGYSPKLYARIIRFSHAFRLKEQFPDLSWTDVTHQAGYFDQMHMIRDFKQFAGVNPSVILRELERSPLANFQNVKL